MREIAIGDWYADTNGFYEVVGFGNKILVREVIFEGEGDDYHLGQELYIPKGQILDTMQKVGCLREGQKPS